jgi:ATP-dependent DNA ligase
LLERLPAGCVIDGEIVITTAHGLDFDALQLRLHPAASRVAKLAQAAPASFVAFDLLAADGQDVMALPQSERRARLERLLANAGPPVYLTPMTRDRDTAARWLDEFEGAGLDGVIAKPADSPYQPGKRAMFKIKHARTADCVVAGFRWYKSDRDAVGSLLLGLYDDSGFLQHVGVTSSFTMAMRRQLIPARTCPGSRSASSACARSNTITSRATGSATPLRSCAGARTKFLQIVAMTSSR